MACCSNFVGILTYIFCILLKLLSGPFCYCAHLHHGSAKCLPIIGVHLASVKELHCFSSNGFHKQLLEQERVQLLWQNTLAHLPACSECTSAFWTNITKPFTENRLCENVLCKLPYSMVNPLWAGAKLFIRGQHFSLQGISWWFMHICQDNATCFPCI